MLMEELEERGMVELQEEEGQSGSGGLSVDRGQKGFRIWDLGI